MLSKSFAILAPLTIAAGMTAAPPATAQAPAVIPSRFVKVVEFSHGGYRYQVDTETGKAVATKLADDEPVAPEPTPNPRPNPPGPNPPVVVKEKAAWVCLFVNPAKADAQWLDSEEIRKAAADRGIKFRGFRSPEPEVDELGYRPYLRANEVPCVILMSDDGQGQGKVLLARKVAGVPDIIKAMDEAR